MDSISRALTELCGRDSLETGNPVGQCSCSTDHFRAVAVKYSPTPVKPRLSVGSRFFSYNFSVLFRSVAAAMSAGVL